MFPFVTKTERGGRSPGHVRLFIKYGWSCSRVWVLESQFLPKIRLPRLEGQGFSTPLDTTVLVAVESLPPRYPSICRGTGNPNKKRREETG